MVRHRLYPLYDPRTLKWSLAWLGWNVALMILSLMFISVAWATGDLQSGPSPIVMIPILGVVLICLLGSLWYVGLLVAAAREGREKSGRLPALRGTKMLREGVVAAFFVTLCTLIPYYALCFALIVLAGMALGATKIAADSSQNLGYLVGLLGAGGVGLAVVVSLLGFMLAATLIVPLLQARYAITGDVKSFLRIPWALRAIAQSPGQYLLCHLAMLVFIVATCFVYIITLGLGAGLMGFFMPYICLNQAYLTGAYYADHLDSESDSSACSFHP